MTLVEELAELLNRHIAENESNTPDWILAEFLISQLGAFDAAVKQRDKWYGITPEPGVSLFEWISGQAAERTANPRKSKPTIEELEKILSDKELKIKVLENGEVTTEKHAVLSESQQ